MEGIPPQNADEPAPVAPAKATRRALHRINDRGTAANVDNALSYWSATGEQRLAKEHVADNRTMHLSATKLGFPSWKDLIDMDFPRPTCPPLLPAGLDADKAKGAFGEIYPYTTRDSHVLKDPLQTDIHVTVDSVTHMTSTTEKLKENRYRLIPAIRPSIEEPTEVWEFWVEAHDDARRRSRRRRYLALFEALVEFPGGVIAIATQTPVRGGGFRFTHLTLYPLDEERSLDRVDEQRRGRILYAAHR